MSDKEAQARYESLMDAARLAKRFLDAVDVMSELPLPDNRPMPERIKMAMSAIERGIEAGDWHCVAQAQVMLEGILAEMKEKGG